MALIEIIAGIATTAVILGCTKYSDKKYYKKQKEREKEAERRAEEERRRRNTPFSFDEHVTQEMFENFANEASKRIKRVSEIKIDGPVINGTVVTQSGISEWHFMIDFNDYGHITGEYWISNDNKDSKIPKVIANKVKENILENISETIPSTNKGVDCHE